MPSILKLVIQLQPAAAKEGYLPLNINMCVKVVVVFDVVYRGVLLARVSHTNHQSIQKVQWISKS